MKKEKILGQVFTESSEIVRMISFYNGDLLQSKILEPSFGSGRFLEHIVREIITLAREKGISEKETATLLNDNIHGYEIDEIYYEQCMRNLEAVLDEENFNENILFDNLKNETAFDMKNINEYDLIIGNPPYVRVQNFSEGIKLVHKTLKRTKGNTDLFLLFIDFFLSRMKKDAQFIFIVPNSFGKSKSARTLRKWFMENGSVQYYDFEDYQLFPNASVYSCIFNFKNGSKDISRFYSPISEGWKHKGWKIHSYEWFEPKRKDIIFSDLGVRNGVATLADSIYIFNKIPNIENVFRIYKASRMKEEKYIIFPYRIVNNLVTRFETEEEFKNLYPKMYKYLFKHKKKLKDRSLEKNTFWFEYGRTQAIKDITKEKYVINTLIKPDQSKLDIIKVKGNSLVYSGLYSTTGEIKKINNKELIKFLRFKAKDMRGGYKKISSSLLKWKKKY